MKRGGLIFLFFCWAFFVNAQSISNYEKLTGIYTHEQTKYIVLRSFLEKGRNRYLVVDPKTLATHIVNATSLEVSPLTFEQIKTQYDTTHYISCIRTAEKNAHSIQDAGITHAMLKERGIVLTIDLCPSKKALDRQIFADLIQEFQKTERPVPMAISVSGLWMLHHQNDLDWLKALIAQHEINVDWINHTYHHPYSPSKTLPLQHNFMLEKGVNLQDEILLNEVAMLNQGLVPSLFFRFPGLVSDDSVFQQVISYGLIPVGSDAWLAKGQKPTEGSFVLIHGNGNEPLGVKKFIQLLRQEDTNIRNKTWLLQDIRDSQE